MNSTQFFQSAMASGKHSDKNYKYQEDEKIIIIILMKEMIDIHQTITIINIINLCNNNTSQVRTITTTVMIVTIKIKESLITIVIVMRILKNIVHIQQKIRYMSVKEYNLKVSMLNQLNSVN
jgi:hypothetical protein